MGCNYLITGAGGQLGSAFLSHVNSQTDCIAYAANCDIRDIKDIKRSFLPKFSTIVNFAGLASVKECEEKPVDCYETNTLSIEKILQVLTSVNFSGKFINIGSINEFAIDKRGQIYAKTKIRAREIVEDYKGKGLDCAQITLGLSISRKKTKNIGTFLQKVIAITNTVLSVSSGNVDITPVTAFNVDEFIRVSSCDNMARYIFDYTQAQQGLVNPYIDAKPIRLREAIVIVLERLGVPYIARDDGYYLLTGKEKVKIIDCQNTDTQYSGLLQPDIEIVESPQPIISDIVSDIINNKYPLNNG